MPDGNSNSMRSAVQLKDNETVVLSRITWPPKAARDKGLKKVCEHPRLQPDDPPMPFAGHQMIFGGFEVLLDG